MFFFIYLGKKGKKNKEKKLSLQDFLAVSAPASSGGTTQVAVSKVSSWAEECEDDDDHKKIEFIQLPTAPRAARILDDDSIPQDPPFRARVANLPFDINEGDVDEFFSDNHIQIREMKLARDEQQDRLRGYGIIEFEAREDLMDALMLTDPTIRGRRIRLELTSDSDTVSGRTVRKRYDNFTPRDSANESTNWRERKESNFETVESRGGDRDGDRRDGNRRSYQPRSNFQNRHENDSRNNNSGEEGGGSNWRLGERNNLGQQDSPPAERKRFGGNNRRFGNNDRGGGERNDRNDRNDRSDRREPRDSPMEERPKLNIAPRTLPLPELNFPKEEELERGTRKISLNGDKESHDDSGLPEDDKDVDDKEVKVDAPKPKPVPKANIFGLAKPVDTAAREKEIEEKREQERSEQARVDKERREKERDEPEREDIEKKDVIVIRTESSRRQDETTNWRKRDDAPATNGSSMDNKTRGGQRQIGRRKWHFYCYNFDSNFSLSLNFNLYS